MSTASKRPLLVLGLVYLVHFAATGVHLPLGSTALMHLGLTPALVGLCFAVRSLTSILAPPLWGAVADRMGSSRGLTVASLLFGAACLWGLAHVASFTWILALSCAWGLLASPTTSLIDGAVLTALGSEQRRFGRVRAFGTIGFGVTALGLGILVGRGGVTASPLIVFGTAAVLSTAASVIALFSPRLPRPRLASLRQLSQMWRSPQVLLLTFIAFLQWGSHAAHTGFLVPLAAAQGYGAAEAGIALALGIGVEVVSMRVATSLLERINVRVLLLGIALVTIVRWLGLALAPGLVAFWVLHALHGITFGMFFPVLVPMMAEATSDDMRQSAQGFLLMAFAAGSALGSLIAGWAFESGGPALVWQSMAGLAAAGLVVVLFLPADWRHFAATKH